MDVPGHILSWFYASWLTIHDVIKLDSALCCRTKRKLFLSSIAECIFCNVHHDLKFMEWAVLRKLKLRHLYLNEKILQFDHQLLNNFLSQTGQYLQKLLMLDLPQNSSSILENITLSCPNLRILHIDNSFVTETLGEFLANCKSLKVVKIRYCENIKAEYFTAYPTTNLRALYLAGVGSYDILIAFSRNGLNLERISLFNCSISDTILTTITKNCSKLKEIQLHYISDITNIAIIAIKDYCESLEGIDIRYCESLTFDCMSTIAAMTSTLVHIYLEDNDFVTDESLSILANHRPNLESLSIGGCIHVSDTGLMAIAEKCPILTTLILESNDSISNEGVQSMLALCLKLRRLGLFHQGIDNNTLASIVENCPLLTDLDIGYNQAVTMNGILSLVEHCKTLQHLYLWHSLLETELTVVHSINPNLTIFQYGMMKCSICLD